MPSMQFLKMERSLTHCSSPKSCVTRQISEEEWGGLFEENQDWITQENLQKLSDYILDCDYASEPTVSNLSKSLKSLCGSSSSSSTQQPLLAIDVTNQSHSEKPEEGLLLHDTMEDENDTKGETWEFTETELETLGLEELEIDDDEESSDSDTLSVYDILKEWEESSEKRVKMLVNFSKS
ncbi:hypothetical protein Bca52824_095607 [Brassica carinata]|uniref:Uncharacterized protein n=1 Tax=Brassica carinata TaxID=52824 RepID=A0A8X7P1S7_BRACI|nr:hypothetical protein Bca52824_095607 [Brassica carinata]